MVNNSDVPLEILIESVKSRCKSITEICIVKVDFSNPGFENYKEYKVENTKIKIKEMLIPIGLIFGHPLGMHEAINMSTNEYLLLSDPDLFFYNDIGKIYLQYMNRYNLNIVGIAHFKSEIQSYKNFPCIINCLLRKSELPPKEWLEGRLIARQAITLSELEMLLDHPDQGMRMDGKFLLQSPIKELMGKWPQPNRLFDVGCNLWLWGEEQNWNWLSFRRSHSRFAAGQIYRTKMFDTNIIKGKVKEPNKRLLYHHGFRPERKKNIEEAYKASQMIY